MPPTPPPAPIAFPHRYARRDGAPLAADTAVQLPVLAPHIGGYHLDATTLHTWQALPERALEALDLTVVE